MTFAEELKLIYDKSNFTNLVKNSLSGIKDKMKKAAEDGYDRFSIELIKLHERDLGVGGVPSNYEIIIIDDRYYIDQYKNGVIEYLIDEFGFKFTQISTRENGNCRYVSRTITVVW